MDFFQASNNFSFTTPTETTTPLLLPHGTSIVLLKLTPIGLHYPFYLLLSNEIWLKDLLNTQHLKLVQCLSLLNFYESLGEFVSV